MVLQRLLLIIVLVNSISIPCGEASWPGTFFWKPRLGIDMSATGVGAGVRVKDLNLDNIHDGYVVLINGYELGLTLMAFAGGLSDGGYLEHLNPMHAWYYTNAWRWGLRHLSMMPYWAGGHGARYVDSHKAWRRRFYYQDKFIPTWLQKIFVWVPSEEWDKEKKEHEQFKKYVEPAFGKHYRYPSPVFNNFDSHRTKESLENQDDSSNTLDSRWNKKDDAKPS